ncbi:hypothetical protein [Pontibacter amylolyticus]|uniref:hypothetical protein n=1 Tax=Pontibacter amylolyticus TaxID=1424080 RepID=UPI00166BF99B|nr:hypothetical protein [Pontibacter amylolyticus]
MLAMNRHGAADRRFGGVTLQEHLAGLAIPVNPWPTSSASGSSAYEGSGVTWTMLGCR